MIKFEVELSEEQLNDMVHVLRLYMKQQYDETTRNPDGPVLPSDDRIKKWNAVAATYAQFEDAYDDYADNIELEKLGVTDVN